MSFWIHPVQGKYKSLRVAVCLISPTQGNVFPGKLRYFRNRRSLEYDRLELSFNAESFFDEAYSAWGESSHVQIRIQIRIRIHSFLGWIQIQIPEKNGKTQNQ